MTLPDAYRDEPEENRHEPDVSKRSRGVALLLSFFGGVFGLHRFYVDKPRTAIAMLCTFGGMGVWYLYDLVLIAAGEFRDSDDLPLRQWGVAEGTYAQHRLVGRAEQRRDQLEEQVDPLRQQVNRLAERGDFSGSLLAPHHQPS